MICDEASVMKPTLVVPRAGERGMNELHFAAYCGDLEAVIAELDNGIDVNGQDDSGYTPLHWVVDMGITPGDREEILNLLIDHGAKIESCDGVGCTPLCVASRTGNDRLVQLLVSAGATVNFRTPTGWTPLLFAADSGNEKSVSLLLDAGADANACTLNGTTAMDLALSAEFEQVAEVLRTRCVN
jgi:ankyrin repeat protein